MSISLSRVESLAVGDVDGGARLVARLRLMGPRGFRARVTVGGAHAEHLTLTAGRALHEGAGSHALEARGKRLNLGLIFTAPLEAGALDCSLTFEWDGGGASAAYEGRVVLFEVDREALDFGDVVIGNNAERTLTVQNRCHAPIEVDLRAPTAPFSCAMTGSHTIEARSALHVPLELSASSAGPLDATLKIARGTQLVSVALTGTGITPAEAFSEAAETSETDDGVATPTEQYGGSGSSAGAYQRLYLHVPTKNTNVSLGKEYDGSQHDPTHAGYSATTEGHVLLRNRVANGTMTLQSKGQGWFQSTTKDVFLGAGDGGFNFISGAGTYLSSGKGIVLAAGHGDIGEMNEFDSGAEPPVPAIASIGNALKGVQLGWKIAGFMMSGFGLAYTGCRIGLTALNKTLNKKWIEPLTLFLGVPLFGLAKNAIVTGLSVADTINKEAKLNVDPILPTAGINLYAEGGFLSATPGFCSVYGVLGASFRSINAGVLGLVNASLDSLVATGMYGFHSAGLSSLKSVTIESGLKTMIATPAGTLDIKGAKIKMTTKLGMLVKGGAGVNLAAPVVETEVGAILALQGKQVQGCAEGMLSIAVGRYGIDISPTGIKVGTLCFGVVDTTKPSLEISPAGVTVMGGLAGPVQLKVTPTGVTMQGPGNDLRHMGVTLLSRATRVELC